MPNTRFHGNDVAARSAIDVVPAQSTVSLHDSARIGFAIRSMQHTFTANPHDESVCTNR